ncbi:MAG: hypothetical protein HZA83_00050, partial [Thaumarchaeota archaeon]|nr:hypothetical protein [Nitrososphaerota archaeon]
TTTYRNANRGFPDNFIESDECTADTTKVNELYCDNSNPNDPILVVVQDTCPSGKTCSQGACISQAAGQRENYCSGPAETTVDINSKVNVVKGTRLASGGGEQQDEARVDFCASANVVRKYFCRNQNSIDSVDKACPDGKVCSDGLCLQPGSTPYCSDDDSTDRKTRGTIEYGVKDSNGNKIQTTNLDDSCSSSGKLKEYYCDGNTKRETEIECNSNEACENGVCRLKTTIPGCFDSDDLDIFQKGENIVTSDAGIQLDYRTDYCSDISQVVEFYCSAGTQRTQTKTCPTNFLCKNGACVKKTTLEPEVTVNIEMKKGWNLFSIPIKNARITGNCERFDSRKKWNYDGNARKWNNPTTFEAGKGYWFKADSECKITATGTSFSRDALAGVNMNAGWNQIGSANEVADISKVLSKCTITHGPWEYNTAGKQYEKATAMVAGKGYFVKLDKACSIGG